MCGRTARAGASVLRRRVQQGRISAPAAEILLRCVGQDFDPLPTQDEDDDPLQPDAPLRPAPQRDWLPHIMVGVTLVVAAMMGYLIYSLS